MSFQPNNITKEHVVNAVQEIKSEGIDLIPSTGYDVVIDGVKYPPKEIMRYAHKQMNGEKLWDRNGGEATNKYLEKFGFEIVEKESNQDLYELKQEFLDKWPLDRVKAMTLEEYTNLNKDDSFCYWVESKTKTLGSIQGGTSYKFGIYKRENTDTEDSRDAYLTDGEYAWLRKYGETKEEAFESVKHLIIQVVEAAVDNKLEVIDGIDLGDAYKWKIAFLYSEYRVINILSAPNIRWSGEYKGFEEANTAPISEIHRYLIDNKPSDLDFYEYSKGIWSAYNKMEGKETEIRTVEKSNFLMSLNQILFGPPGTGKTYHTVNKALQIVDPDFYESNKKDREALTNRYRELLITDWAESKKRRIAFTTFHQSFTYEDFVEGIKPDVNNEGELSYKIEDGIFKRLCRKAKYYSEGEAEEARERVRLSDQDFKKAQFFKVSLGNTNKEEDDEIYQYCIDHGKISIGYLDHLDLKGKSESEIKGIVQESSKLSEFSSRAMYYFIHYLKKGHYVLVSKGNSIVRAIGQVTGDYKYKPDAPISYPHFRDVSWLVKDVEIPIEEIYEKNLQQQPIYMLKKDWVSREFFEKQHIAEVTEGGNENFVLIIDEINRGNIAQIFGELITLIEPDKREGGKEEQKAILPYSKKPFSVPSNLHIIGTMNTADRSIEALDTALRRRFTFEEMPPKQKVIEEEGSLKEEKSEIHVGESYILLSTILETINKRIEKLLDKDHLIGHSYFMDVKEVSDLQRVFYRNIIPLLEEYFYGDKGKIQLVLVKGFIKQAEHSGETDLFAQSEYDDSIFDDREVWELTTVWKYNDKAFEEALNVLLNKKA